MKKILGLLAVTAVVGAMLIPAAPASAANAGGAGAGCSVTLPKWPDLGGGVECHTGALPTDGKAVGAFLPGGPVCLPLCDFKASVDSYGETCVGGLPPLLGTASGTITVSNATASVSAPYAWQRVGLVAVITLSGGTTGGGVAAFVPTPPIPTCAAPGPLTAHVVGAAVAAQ